MAERINPAGLNKLYSPKQQQVLRYTQTHDYRMCINHGAKRSGKTIIDNDIFVMDVARVKCDASAAGVIAPQYILAGATISSIRRNVLSELEQKYGITIKLDRYNAFELFGVRIYCFGHSKINDKDKIRGMSSWGAYINEATLANEEVFDEINGRCSEGKAHIIMDTNPDRPGHWLKTKYVDKAWQIEKGSTGDPTIIDFHWEIDDNTFLDKDYVKNIKRTTPAGMFYARNIKGEWVAAEGLVYPDFNRAVHYVHAHDVKPIVRFFAGMDFGWEHPGAFVIIGEAEDGTQYILKEWSEQHRSIDDWTAIVGRVQKQLGIKLCVWCDSARPDLISTLKCAGLDARNAKKDVVAGIGEVATGFKTQTLYVIKENVKRFDEEIDTYCWKDGIDEPIKQHDDVMDAIRYAIYSDKISREQRARLNGNQHLLRNRPVVLPNLR